MQTKSPAHDIASSCALLYQIASVPQVWFFEGIMGRMHNLKLLHFGFLSEKNRNEGFLQHVSLVKKENYAFLESRIILSLSCGELGL